MRNNLHGLAEILTVSLLRDHIIIDAARSHIVGLTGAHIQETLIMSKVEISFSPIIGYVTFAMLVWVKRSRVDVDIRVEFLNGDRKSSGLQQLTQRS